MGPGLTSVPTRVPAGILTPPTATTLVFDIAATTNHVVVGIRRERRGNHAGRLNAANEIVIDQGAVCDPRPRVSSWEEPLRPLERRKHHIYGDIAIRVAIDLDAGAMHTLDPCVLPSGAPTS